MGRPIARQVSPKRGQRGSPARPELSGCAASFRGKSLANRALCRREIFLNSASRSAGWTVPAAPSSRRVAGIPFHRRLFCATVREILSVRGGTIPIGTSLPHGIFVSMQASEFVDGANLPSDSTDAKQTLRVVIAYDAAAAGKCAVRWLADLDTRSGDDIEFRPFPWSFRWLADADWRAEATSDAVSADILILATSSGQPLPPAVEQWAGETINQMHGGAAVIALFGPEENLEEVGSSRLEALETAAQRAGLAFFASTPRREFSAAIEPGQSASGRLESVQISIESQGLASARKSKSAGSRLGGNRRIDNE